MDLSLDDLDYYLPEGSIAQHPVSPRDASRLLFLNGDDVIHSHFTNLPDLLKKDTILVLNDTKVLQARFYAIKDTGARIEFLIVSPLDSPDGYEFEALAKPRKRLKKGMQLIVGEGIHLDILSLTEEGVIIKFNIEGFHVLSKYGITPLPPYINRSVNESDKEDYQTVYSSSDGSVAAPTAGLHFTQDLLGKLIEKGIEIVYITLHVGLGTFKSLTANSLKGNSLHPEMYSISEETASFLHHSKAEGKRIIAVGTTTTRVLETWGFNNSLLEGHTRLFIKPSFKFKVINGLITNFHLPQSSLLALVFAFAGREKVMNAYNIAIKEGYRFYSYGDAMLILP
jgi:S-adenosylmethionine:tRNA ribosyltransferase-isomerase